MSYKVTDFPQYRKLSNDKVFYRIRDDRNFDEIHLIGNRASWFSMEAKQYREIVKIQDLLAETDGFVSSTKDEFEALMSKHGFA